MKSFNKFLPLLFLGAMAVFFALNTVNAQVIPANASMKVTRVDQNLNPISGTQAQIFGVERDTSGVMGIRRIYSPLYSTNPTLFTTDLQTINNELASTGKSYSSGFSLSVTDLPFYDEYLGGCTGTNCTPSSFFRMFGGMSRSFCNGTVCTEAEDIGPGQNIFIKYVPNTDTCPAGKHPFPDVTSVPCFLRSTLKAGGGTELKLESTPNIVGSCSLKTTYQPRSGIPYPVNPVVAGQLSVSSPGVLIVANTSANVAIGEDTLPSLLNCPVDYVAMCSISDTGSNLCGCYFPHVPGETWATIKPSNFTCVDDPINSGTTDWVDVPLSGTDSFDINAEYRYKISTQSNFWLYPKEISARSLVSNESYFGQIFYVNADTKAAYQYNGNFLDTVVQIQKRVLPPWTDVPLTGIDPFDLTHEYRFKMTVPGRPGVPAGDFWYYAKQVGTQSLVMNNGYGEITFVSAANKTAYLSQGTPTGITISQMQRRALTWTDVPLNTTEAYDVSCDYRFKMNYPASPQWRPAVPAGDFWHYPERTSAQSHIANANGGYQTFSVFANNKTVFDFNGVKANTVLQMEKRCNAPAILVCPAGQEKVINPASPVCILRANVKGVQDTDFLLTGYDHLDGNCTLAGVVPQAPQTASTSITVTAGLQRTAWAQSSPWPFQLDTLFTCPANTTKTLCAFTSGTGPLGEIVCGCYPAGVTPPAKVQEPTYMCVPAGCAEGQYWCNAENTCKSAGQACTATCATSSAPVSWTQYINPSPNNINSPSAPSLGTASGSIQVDGKTIQVNYAGDVRSVGIASNWSWVWTGNTAPFLSTLVPNIPDPAHLLGVFGGSQAMNTLTFSQPVTDPILLFYSIGNGSVTATYEFDRPFTIVTGSTGLPGQGDFVNPSGNILKGTEGYGVIQFHGTFSTLSFKVPTAEYWSAFTVGLKPASTCPSAVTCNNNNTCETGESCNCADCTNGGADDKDKCGLTGTGSQMVCTKDIKNTTTGGTASTEKWEAYSYSSAYIFLAKQPVVANTVAGKTFYVYNPERIILNMTKAQFLANPATAIKNALPLPLGTTRTPRSRLQFNMAQLMSETPAVQATTIDNLDASVANRFLCKTIAVGATDCHVNNGGPFMPAFSYSPTGTIYASYTDSSSGVGYTAYQRFGTFEVPASFDATNAQANFVTVDTELKPYLLQSGNANISAGEFGTAATNLQMTQDSQLTFFPSFTKDESWARVKVLLSISDSTPVLWSQTSTQYGNTGSIRFLYSYVIQQVSGVQKQILFATEYLTDGHGWRKVYLIGKDFPLPQVSSGAVQVGACCPAGAQWDSSQNKCVTPTPPGCAEGQYFCSSENVCKPAGQSCSPVTCNNDDVCNADESCDCADCNDLADHCGLDTSNQQMICTKDTAPVCYTDKFPYCLPACLDGQKLDPATGKCISTPINPNLIVNGDFEQGNIGFTSEYAYATTILSEGTYTVGLTGRDMHPTLDNCTDHSGTGKFMGINGGSNPASNIYCQQVNVEKNTDYSLSAWATTLGTPAAVLNFSINSQNIGSSLALPNTDICYWAQFTGQWNSGVNTTANICVKNTNTTVSGNDFAIDDMVFKKTDTVVTTTSSSTTQVGACCPAGSAWNSVENRCIPTTCGEGKFYCAAQKKCLNGGETCDTTVCNNDGVCSGDESCQCADCVNGGADDQDKCGMVNGKQAVCSDDNLNDGKPGACCVAPKKWNTATNTCAECMTTQAPSEIQFGLDKPYITCTGNGDTSKTHFKYRLTPSVVSATSPVFTSDIFPVGTQVLHTAPLPLGTYTVECFYGNGANVDTSTAATPNSCTKNIDVKNTAQGCSRVYAYRGDTLSDEMTGTSSFDASFRCGSRLPSTGFTNPFALRFGTENPAYLDYDPVYSLFLDYLGVGPLSTQTNNYTVPTGTTNISCAIKIGTGYSTNNACNLRACAGGTCAVPQTFSVVSSGNATCTTKDEEEYNIGCNPDAPEATRIACAAWFSNLFAAQTSAGVKTFKAKFTFNGANDEIGCTKYAPGSMPGGLNMYENYVCKKILTSGELVEIYAADNSGSQINSLQTTSYTVKKDNEKPDLQEVKYYTDTTRTNLITDISKWQKGSITAQITCLDRPLEESTSCACAKDVDPSSSDADKWSVGTPDLNLGADVMYYTRTLTGSVSGQTVRVHDTADNKSDAARTIDIGIDALAPTVTVADTGSGTTRTVIITATDTTSKIWKTTETPSQGTNTNGIIFRKIPKADISNASALYDEGCSISNPNYATITETKTASFPGTTQVTIPGVNFSTEAVTYCVQDNAGNVTRGVYPSDPVGCFSSTNMNPVPTVTTYKTPLQASMTANQYGYSLSENATNATCFRGILSNNVTTLVTNQYNASNANTLNWSTPATLKNTSTPNTNGYYYFSTIAGNTLSINNTPTGTGSKAVIVEGGNIQINSNIDYSGTDKTLILIARKNTTTNVGGNIYINPSVTRIDAIIIADGALINATTAITGSTSTTTTKNWIDNPSELSNRLTINGRIYSFNTRGGSLNADLTPITANGKYFLDSTLKTDGTPAKSASMDLEGFRLIKNDGNNTCPTNISYRLFTNATLPRLLQRPTGYTGGSCGF